MVEVVIFDGQINAKQLKEWQEGIGQVRSDARMAKSLDEVNRTVDRDLSVTERICHLSTN